MSKSLNRNNITAQFYFQYPNFTFDVELDIPAEGVTAIFGHSGAGKTTLLRCIAGLEKVADGHVTFGENEWQSADLFVPTHRRPIGYVFQSSALFEHLTVAGNLNYGRKRAINGANDSEYADIVELFGISHLLSSHAEQLSGGEMQRVAIARALMLKPDILMLDEPLNSNEQK